MGFFKDHTISVFLVVIFILGFFGFRLFIEKKSIDEVVREVEPVKRLFSQGSVSQESTSKPMPQVDQASKALANTLNVVQNTNVSVVTMASESKPITLPALQQPTIEKMTSAPESDRSNNGGQEKGDTGITAYAEFWDQKKPENDRVKIIGEGQVRFDIYDGNFKLQEQCVGQVRASGYRKYNNEIYYLTAYSMRNRYKEGKQRYIKILDENSSSWSQKVGCIKID